MNRFLSYYIEKFKSLKRGLTPQGLAPHKPLLLLSVIVAIEKQTPGYMLQPGLQDSAEILMLLKALHMGRFQQFHL